MRHLNIDWKTFHGHLKAWGQLSARAKRAYVQMRPSEAASPEPFSDAELKLLTDRKLLKLGERSQRLRVPPEGREFFKAMRAMDRHPIDKLSTETTLISYATEHLTASETSLLFTGTHDGFHAYGGWGFKAATEQAWLRQVLDLPSVRAASKWEHQRLPDAPVGPQLRDGSPYFTDAAVFEATRQLLEAAMSWREPAPLAKLPDTLPDIRPDVLWKAVMAAIRYLLLFPTLDEDGMPIIGIWPEITHLLHRPEPRAPRPEQPLETFHAPLLIEDMTTVLVSAAAEPLRVLANGDGLYAKDHQRLAETILATPDWLSDQAFDTDAMPELWRPAERVPAAIDRCLRMDMLASREGPNGRTVFEITAAGQAWLGRDLADRIRGMLDPWRQEPQPQEPRKAKRRRTTLMAMIADRFVAMDGEAGSVSPWVPGQLRWYLDRDDHDRIDWRAAFADALAEAEHGFVPVPDLLEYHGRVNNPLLGRRRTGSYGPAPRMPRVGHALSEPGELDLENIWQDLLWGMIADTLVPLGAVELGLGNGGLMIRLHPIGRYMLAQTDTLDYAARPEGDVIVQPNFEVTFLGPSPRAEAAVGRLAERTGAQLGTLFRITRASVLAAAAAGITADQALADLDAVTSKPLPENVRREIVGWFTSVRRVRLRPTWIIDAPDEPTARQILAAAGANAARQISPTLLEITTRKQSHAALRRKLKQSGIFVQ